MTPLIKKLLLVAAAGLVGSLATIPELAAFHEPLKWISGFIAGGAVVPRPGDVTGAK